LQFAEELAQVLLLSAGLPAGLPGMPAVSLPAWGKVDLSRGPTAEVKS